MESGSIISLLAQRHSSDIFVTECPIAHGSRRLDAWALEPTWTESRVYGYEVKVTRSDFLRDTKWREYLEFCNYFYFVAPKGVLSPDEIEPQVGIIEPASTGTRLFTRRKAQWREAPALEEVLKAVLMNRTKIVPSHYGRMLTPDTKAEFWQRWLESGRYEKDLGHRVGKKLRSIILQKIEAVEDENRRLRYENEELAAVKKFCDDHRINIHSYQRERQLRDLREIVPQEHRRTLEVAHSTLGSLLQTINNPTHEITADEF